MVYTHYWAYQPDSPQFTAIFPRLVADSRDILAHLADRGVPLAGPTGIGEPLLNEAIIAVNGTRPETGENFVLAPGSGSGIAAHTEDGAAFRMDWCQTRHLPYDLAVTAILLRAAHLAPRHVSLASDGSWPLDWDHARQLLTALFGADDPGSRLRPLAELGRGPEALHTRALAHAA
ncbi:MAG TPA: hypothetical protein VL551_27620 [Actinospica sp.]|jgi:hypothetical protein|nr:hypothetical protein [Actinospica sp.]